MCRFDYRVQNVFTIKNIVCVCVCSSPLSANAVLDVSSAAGRRRWLHVDPEWSPQNMFPLQGLLEKRGCVCVRPSCASGDKMTKSNVPYI